jgi:hypothetical protein
MNLFFTIVAALPIGFLVGRRLTALLTYLVVDSFFFTFQSIGVLLTWMSGSAGLGGGSGFGDAPAGSFPIDYSHSEYIGYGVVNLVITLVGTGLVLLGVRIRARCTASADVVDVH